MPLLWTGVSFAVMGSVNPLLAKGVDWSWFIASQFFFGVAAAIVVIQAGSAHPILAGLKGGLAGGLVMAIPALLWSLITGHGIWYPANLLAGMVLPGLGSKPVAEMVKFREQWLVIAIVVHAVMSTGFGIVYALLLPVLRPIPAPLAWGGLLLPLLWTATSHSLMGVVNPLLQKRVDWPWFVISQFVFGVVAAIVVLRSEKVYIAPIGRGSP
jgi:small basic protein